MWSVAVLYCNWNNVQLFSLLYIFCVTFPIVSNGQLDLNPAYKYSEEANHQFIPNVVSAMDDKDEKYANSQHGHINENRKTSEAINSDMSSVWLQAIGSTLVISVAPFILLYITPLDSSDSMRPRLKIILAFASGGLLGDAFLHLIPHAVHKNEHSEHGHNNHGHHSHAHNNHGDDMTIGLWVLGGIIAFLLVEKLVRLLKCSHQHRDTLKKPALKQHIKQFKKSQKLKSSEATQEHVEVSGYLNLAADFAHNFTDGLAIGASYLSGKNIGMMTTITILLHEVPHEIGDFAILIKSGCSRSKAMMLQLLTAFGAIAGNVLVLCGASDQSVTLSWVLPFTAGGFIYIATVNVLPELLENSTKLIQSLKEIAALLSGVGLMIIIDKLE